MKKRKLKTNFIGLLVLLVIVLIGIMGIPYHQNSEVMYFNDLKKDASEVDDTSSLKSRFQLQDAQISSSKWYEAETQALFMEKGTHQITLSYKSNQLFNYYEIYAPNEMNDTGAKGRVYKTGVLNATHNKIKNETITFNLPHNVNGVQVRLVYQNSIYHLQVGIATPGDFDLVWYFVFFAGVIIILYYLLFVKYGDEDRGSRAVILMLVGLIAYLSLPLLNDFIGHGMTSDILYHLPRIDGLYQGLKSGEFPVYLNPKQGNMYGYASSIMYPQLFLYIPALLRLGGMSLMNAFRLFMIIMNSAVVLISYFSFKDLFQKRKIAVVSCFGYAISMYFICNQYLRGALGETLAMIFMPLLLMSLYEIFMKDEKKWPFLVIALTGILESHIISTFICGCIAFVAFLCFIPYMLEHHFLKRLFALIKAGVITVLLNLFFLVPFLTYYQLPLNVNSMPFKDQLSVFLDHATYVSEIFISQVHLEGRSRGLGTTVNVMPLTVGTLSLFVIIGFLILYICAKDLIIKRKEGKFILHLGLVSTIASVILLYMTTYLFPWSYLTKLPLFKMFVSVQFTWRFLSQATLFIALLEGCLAYCVSLLLEERTMMTQSIMKYVEQGICFVMVGLIVLNSSVFMNNLPEIPPLTSKVEVEAQNNTDDLYLYSDCTALDEEERGNIITSSVSNTKITHFTRDGLRLSFNYTLPQGSQSAELTMPLEYYPSYKAVVNGATMNASYGKHHFVLAKVTQNSGKVTVYYQAPKSFGMAYLVSSLTLVALVLIGFMKKIRRIRVRNSLLQ